MSHGRLLAFTVAVSIVAMVLTMGATLVYVVRATDARRADQVEACERGNAIRLELNAIVVMQDLRLPLLDAVDCQNVIE